MIQPCEGTSIGKAGRQGDRFKPVTPALCPVSAWTGVSCLSICRIREPSPSNRVGELAQLISKLLFKRAA